MFFSKKLFRYAPARFPAQLAMLAMLAQALLAPLVAPWSRLLPRRAIVFRS